MDPRFPHGFWGLHGPQTSTWPLAAPWQPQLGLQRQYRLWTVSCFSGATQATDINMTSCSSTDHRHPQGLQGYHGPGPSTWPLTTSGPQTSTWSRPWISIYPLAIKWTKNINIVSDSSTETNITSSDSMDSDIPMSPHHHRHQHGLRWHHRPQTSTWTTGIKRA